MRYAGVEVLANAHWWSGYAHLHVEGCPGQGHTSKTNGTIDVCPVGL